MSDAFWISLFGFLTSVSLAIFTLRKVVNVSTDMVSVKHATNGLVAKLTQAGEQRGLLQGRAEGAEAERQRMNPSTGDNPPPP